MKKIIQKTYEELEKKYYECFKQKLDYFKYADYLFENRDNITYNQHQFVHRMMTGYDRRWMEVKSLIHMVEECPDKLEEELEKLGIEHVKYVVYGIRE